MKENFKLSGAALKGSGRLAQVAAVPPNRKSWHIYRRRKKLATEVKILESPLY